jgi:hypothetical protein
VFQPVRREKRIASFYDGKWAIPSDCAEVFMIDHEKLQQLQRAFVQVLQKQGPWILAVFAALFVAAAAHDFLIR